MQNVLKTEKQELQVYITELRGVNELANYFRKACLDMVIAHIPNIFIGFSFQDKYFYDTPCTSDLNFLADALKDNFNTRWWEEYAVYLFSQAIYHHPSSNFDSQVDIDKLNRYVNLYVEPLNYLFYKYVGRYYVSQYFRNEHQELLRDSKGMRERYISILKSHTAIHELWFSTGEWAHPDLELYFHIIKLLQIGMTEEEATSLLNELKENGLDVPDCLLNSWTLYRGYLFGKELITYSDMLNCFASKLYSPYDAEPAGRFLVEFGPKY